MAFWTSIQLLYLKYKRCDLLDLLPGPSAKCTLSANERTWTWMRECQVTPTRELLNANLHASLFSIMAHSSSVLLSPVSLLRVSNIVVLPCPRLRFRCAGSHKMSSQAASSEWRMQCPASLIRRCLILSVNLADCHIENKRKCKTSTFQKSYFNRLSRV